MQALVNWFKENWVNQSIGLLFFVVGIGLGLLIGLMVLRGAKKEGLKKKQVVKKDITHIKNIAINEYQKDKASLEMKKVGLIFDAFAVVLEEIPKEYDEKPKFYKVVSFNKVKFLEKDLKVCLDFSLGELLAFLQSLLDIIEYQLFTFLDCKFSKKIYGVGRFALGIMTKQSFSKEAKDIVIADAKDVIQKIFAPKNETKKKGLKSKLLAKGLGGIMNKTNEEIEEYILSFIDSLCDVVNLLYSGGYKDGATTVDIDDIESDLEVV